MRRCNIIYGRNINDHAFIVWDELQLNGETVRYAVRRSAIEGVSLVYNANAEYELRILTRRRCVCMFFDKEQRAKDVLFALVGNAAIE